MVKFVEHFDYDREFFEVWHNLENGVYTVDALSTDQKFYFDTKQQYQKFIRCTEFYKDWRTLERTTKVQNHSHDRLQM